MRIAMGQLWQETNTLNPIPTTWDDFASFGVHEGDDLLARFDSTNELGGFIQELRGWPEQPDLVPLVRLAAWPSGPLTPEAHRRLLDRLAGELEKAGPVDGVLLALHGALVAEDEPDVSGLALERVREWVGPSVPVVATLDLHANVTGRMVREADALVMYHTAPHIDVMGTGRRAARVLHRLLAQGARPVTAFVKMPCVLPVERANTQDPASPSFALREKLQACEDDPRVLAAGLATVQPWLDIPDLGSAVVVATDGDPALAQALAAGIARDVWQRKDAYFPELHGIEEAVRLAHALPAGLAVLGDGADATTSGSTGRSTAIIAELLRYEWPRPALAALVAPELVSAERPMLLGTEWEAERRFDARFTLSGHLAEKLPIDMGRAVVLRRGNVRVVATSRTGPHFAPQLFEAAGFDPFAASVVVAKSPCGFRAAYGGRAALVLSVRGEGCAPPEFWKKDFRNIPRPLWPWDEMGEWTPRVALRT
ncbi:MAG: M81 family metallopeptidase [Gemmataceae bacterium]|nr:M81 family metallopeptidase [Gemmataceae bacterium]